MSIPKSGQEAERRIRELLDQASEARDALQNLAEELELAEKIFHVVEQDPELFDAMRKRAEKLDPFDTFDMRRSMLQATVESSISESKELVRLLKSPVSHKGFKLWSKSGGYKQDWDISVIKQLGYGAIVIGNKPLIATREMIDKTVWDAAVEQGLIDPDRAAVAGGFVQEPRTRPTYLKEIQAD